MSASVLLTHEESLVLIRLAQAGDMDARQTLVERNSALVKCLVKKFVQRAADYDDLYQIGSLGLIKAILNYDEKYNVRFSTYAVPMIIGELKRHLRDDGAVRISRSMKELAVRARKLSDELRVQLGREPQVNELCERLGVSREDLVMALESLRPTLSLFEPVYEDDSTPVLLMDILPQQAPESEIVDMLTLKDMLGKLEPQERKILFMRYFLDKTQSEIAGKMGLSQVQISRMESRIIKKMRAYMD